MMNSLKEPSNKNGLEAVKLAMGASTIIYISVALLGLFFFGSTVDQNVLINVSLEGNNWESVFLRVTFLVILGCHIPFIFFTGKESMLIIIDELEKKSVSIALQEKLQEIRRKSVIPEAKVLADEILVTESEVDINDQLKTEMKRASSMAYKEMDYWKYFTGTTLLYLAEIIIALSTDDIGLLFEFLSAISISCIAFLFPGLMFLIADKKFATTF